MLLSIAMAPGGDGDGLLIDQITVRRRGEASS